MINLKAIQENMQPDITAVADWCDEIYHEWFASFFKEARELFIRLKSKMRPITDDELSWILINLTLNLFSVSESLNKFRVSQEVIKLKTKQRELNIAKVSMESSAAKRNEEATLKTLEDKLLATAYTTIINRVESEISFSRELIMSAKKVWDARKRTEQINPVSEVNAGDSTLPDYTRPASTYIRGDH